MEENGQESQNQNVGSVVDQKENLKMSENKKSLQQTEELKGKIDEEVSYKRVKWIEKEDYKIN